LVNRHFSEKFVGAWRAMPIYTIVSKYDKNQIVMSDFSVGAHTGAPLQILIDAILETGFLCRKISLLMSNRSRIPYKTAISSDARQDFAKN